MTKNRPDTDSLATPLIRLDADGQRAWIREILDLLDMKPTPFAMRAGLVSTTLTRFLNKGSATHALSTASMNKLLQTAIVVADERGLLALLRERLGAQAPAPAEDRQRDALAAAMNHSVALGELAERIQELGDEHGRRVPTSMAVVWAHDIFSQVANSPEWPACGLGDAQTQVLANAITAAESSIQMALRAGRYGMTQIPSKPLT